MIKTIVIIIVALAVLVLFSSFINPLPIIAFFNNLGFIGSIFGGFVTFVSRVTQIIINNYIVFAIIAILLFLFLFRVIINAIGGAEE